jgi:tetraacyldisaccharide 4'-kinase
MIRAPKFWQHRHHPASIMLTPAAWVWQAVTNRRRATTIAQKSPIPSLCIGNVTAGGAGKTPTALLIAQLLQQHGAHPAFGNRGYGTKSSDHCIRVNPAQHSALQVGDEALLLAATAPTYVCTDRYAASVAAAHDGATHIIFDDGLQNPKLAYDRSLLVLDGSYGLGNGRIIPAGPLREPLCDALSRCHAVLIIGEDKHQLSAQITHKPVFKGQIIADSSHINRAERYLAFTGIAHPEKFYATCQELGLHLTSTRSFPDHHNFDASELVALAQAGMEQQATLLTTTKDAARLSPAWRARVTVLPISLQLDDSAALLQLIT